MFALCFLSRRYWVKFLFRSVSEVFYMNVLASAMDALNGSFSLIPVFVAPVLSVFFLLSVVAYFFRHIVG